MLAMCLQDYSNITLTRMQVENPWLKVTCQLKWVQLAASANFRFKKFSGIRVPLKEQKCSADLKCLVVPLIWWLFFFTPASGILNVILWNTTAIGSKVSSAHWEKILIACCGTLRMNDKIPLELRATKVTDVDIDMMGINVFFCSHAEVRHKDL